MNDERYNDMSVSAHHPDGTALTVVYPIQLRKLPMNKLPVKQCLSFELNQSQKIYPGVRQNLHRTSVV